MLFIISIKDNLSRQTYLFLPCKGLPSFLVASGGVRPIKVALFHLHGNSRHCRQQTSLGANKKTKLSGRQSYFREQNTMPTREAIYLFCFIFKFWFTVNIKNSSCSVHLFIFFTWKSNMTFAAFHFYSVLFKNYQHAEKLKTFSFQCKPTKTKHVSMCWMFRRNHSSCQLSLKKYRSVNAVKGLKWIQVDYLEDGFCLLRTLVGHAPLHLQLPKW